MITHEEISKRAREIWEREGCPEGRDIEHWLQAETELAHENHGVRAHAALTAPDTLTKAHSDGNGQENARKRTMRRGK
jgi:hypothetical protein